MILGSVKLGGVPETASIRPLLEEGYPGAACQRLSFLSVVHPSNSMNLQAKQAWPE